MKMKRMIKVLKALIPMICLQTHFYLRREVELVGLPFTIEAIGGSVARQRAARVSMIKLIQSN